MTKLGGPKLEPYGAGPVPVIDDPTGFEVYAEGPVNLFAAGSNVSISLYSPRSDPAGKLYRVVIGRVVMPANGAHGLAVALFDFLNRTGLNPDNQGKPGDSSRPN